MFELIVVVNASKYIQYIKSFFFSYFLVINTKENWVLIQYRVTPGQKSVITV